MNSRIEQIISDIEEYIESCKYQPLSTTKIVVNKEEIEELLRELRLKTPDEIKRYQKVISNKDNILADAQKKAEEITARAERSAQEMVNQHEIMQKAYAQATATLNEAQSKANQMIQDASREAEGIRLSAFSYTDELLANIEVILGQALDDAGGKYRATMDAFSQIMETVRSNRNELSPQTAQAAALNNYAQQPPAVAPVDDDGSMDDLEEDT